MSPSGFSLASLIEAARDGVRRDNRVAITAAALLVVPALLAIAWILAGGPLWVAPSPIPLILEVTGIAAIAFVLLLVGRAWRRGTDEKDLAATAEHRAGLPPGSVLGALELGRNVPSGTSPSLARRAGAEITRHFEGVSASDVSGDVGRTARRRRSFAVAGLVVFSAIALILGVASPARTQGGWTPLLNPIGHLSAPALPGLLVRPGNTEVLRGADLEIEIQAPGRANVVVLSRAEGDVLRRQTAPVDGATARARIERIDASTEYWVEAPDGARSETFTVVPRDPLLVSELVVEVRYPAYVNRPAERYTTDVPLLEIPEGTTLLVNGRATRPLQAAALADAESSIPLRIEGDRFGTSWTPRESGTWAWQLRDATGSQLVTAPAPLEVTVVADAPPDVEVTFPGVDTVLDPERVQVIAADARDDYGVGEAVLVSWRVMSGGRTEPRTEEPIAISEAGERVLLRAVLDARERELLPGDTLKYFVRAIDGSPRRQAGESQIYALYIPSAEELRDQATREADEALDEAERLSESARQLQNETRNLQRRTEANRARNAAQAETTRSGSSEQGSMEFRESEQARQVLEQQEQLVGGLEELQERMAALEKLMETAGLRDEQLRERMDELRELYDELLTPELKKQMDELRESLEKLDPEQLQKALEQLQQQQEQLAEQLEKSLEQLRKAATEQRANALAQDARELATQQQALADAMKDGPTREQTETQQRLEQKAQELGQQIGELGKDLESQRQEQASKDAGNAQQQTESAQQAMREAGQRAQSQQGEQASQAGQQAAKDLEQAANNLDAARQSIADASKQEAQEGMQQAMNEALSLAERQQNLLDQMKKEQEQAGQQQGQQQQSGQQGQQQQQGQRGQQQQGQQQGGQQQQQGNQAGGQQGGAGNQNQQGMQSEQSALQQGLEQLSRNLGELSQQTGMVSRDVGAALGRANLSMQQTMQAMQESQQSGRMPTEQASQSVEDLNRLALALLQNQQQMQQGENQAGMQQALQQMQNLAQQQGQLNGRANSLMPMQLNQQAMAQQTQRLAQDQRNIANQLTDLNQRMGGREDVLGRVDELAREADAIARAMERGGPPPQVLARQERLFHRLLDAGRTLEKDEESDERVGESPGDFERNAVGALNPALFESATRYRVPTPEELRGLPPAYRKLILDYFQRINRKPDPEGREPM
jgi:hypothetical protein